MQKKCFEIIIFLCVIYQETKKRKFSQVEEMSQKSEANTRKKQKTESDKNLEEERQENRVHTFFLLNLYDYVFFGKAKEIFFTFCFVVAQILSPKKETILQIYSFCFRVYNVQSKKLTNKCFA